MKRVIITNIHLLWSFLAGWWQPDSGPWDAGFRSWGVIRGSEPGRPHQRADVGDGSDGFHPPHSCECADTELSPSRARSADILRWWLLCLTVPRTPLAVNVTMNPVWYLRGEGRRWRPPWLLLIEVPLTENSLVVELGPSSQTIRKTMVSWPETWLIPPFSRWLFSNINTMIPSDTWQDLTFKVYKFKICHPKICDFGILVILNQGT